jgi:hypothetical protein
MTNTIKYSKTNRTRNAVSSKCVGSEADLFTSVLYNHYSAPKGFCFDVLCEDDPIIDNINSADYNVDEKVGLSTFHGCNFASSVKFILFHNTA